MKKQITVTVNYRPRYLVEGTWSGYTSGQRRVVHREVVNHKRAEAIRELHMIRYTDGTCLYLSVRELAYREKAEKPINGYKSLIDDCLRHGVNSVSDLQEARK